jgi:hypothetical protein
MQNDPSWRHTVLFNEYFNGATGTDLGASHQTGWTGLEVELIRRRHRQCSPSEIYSAQLTIWRAPPMTTVPV